VASVLYYLSGIGGSLGNIAVFVYWLRRHEFPVVLGIQLNGGAPFSEPDRYPFFQTLFILILGVDVLAARGLQQSRRWGGILGLLLAPVGFAFGVGFQLPFWLLVAPLRAVLIGWGWRSLR
jgi:hypothetical protein